MTATGPIEADRLLMEARRALKDLELDKARGCVLALREHLEFPRSRPKDLRSGAWILEGIRIRMFIDCEQMNKTAVNMHVKEIVELEAENPEVIPKVAASWALGWQLELEEEYPIAYAYRHGACALNRPRIAQLARPDVPWRFGEATEAALLVDCYADWIRMIRILRRPIATMATQRTPLAETFRRHPMVDLLDHDEFELLVATQGLLTAGV